MVLKSTLVRSHQIVFYLVLLCSFAACKKSSPTGPELLHPGRRDYEWTIDTVYTPKGSALYLTRIWGSDPQNLWAVGFGSPSIILVWHYDGKQWRTDSTTSLNTPFSIFGFGRNDVWIGNTSSAIWRCTDSKHWNKFTEQRLPDYPYISYLNIWGVSPSEVYAAGYAEDVNRNKFKMVVEKFDGKSWEFMNTPNISVELTSVRKHTESGVLILGGLIIDPIQGITFKVYSFNGREVKELYSGQDGASINNMNGEIYIQTGQKLFKYKDGGLVLWKDFTNTNYLSSIWGRNENDFFYRSIEKGNFGIGHYNGSDLVTLFNPTPNFSISEAVIFDKEVFFLAHDDISSNSLIVHGKLKGDIQSKEN